MIPEETGGPYPADGTNTHGGGARAAQHLTGNATQGYVATLSIAVNG
ncbi:hypothetical protein [Janthinobacterium svalbardensis]